MNWKHKLEKLEETKQWDDAIVLLQQQIVENPNNMNAYIFINYLLMNLLVEEYYDKSKEKNYEELFKWYFDDSYKKFYHDPEYLYITGRIALISPWLLGIDDNDCNSMLHKAMELDPNNEVYQETYYWSLYDKDPHNSTLIAYAKKIVSEPSPIEDQLKKKGAVGKYLLEAKKHWCRCVLWSAQN